MEITAKQVAAAFGVKPGTVISWVAAKRLRGTLPRKARRIGRRFRVADVRQFAEDAGDEGYTSRQFEEWLERNREAVIAQQPGGISSTGVLTSKP